MELALLSNLDIVKFIDVSGLFRRLSSHFNLCVYSIDQTFLRGVLRIKYSIPFVIETDICLPSVYYFVHGFFAASKVLAVSQDGMSYSLD